MTADTPGTSSTGSTNRIISGRYELRRERGRGPRAVVYEAHDLVLGRPVIVTEFLADALDAERLKVQEAEVRRVAHLEHPALTRLFDAGIDQGPDGRPFIFLVADYNDGRDLRDAVSEAPVSEESVAHLGHGLAEALATIHDTGLVHGNVTPSNILFRRRGETEPAQGTLTDLEIGYLVNRSPAIPRPQLALVSVPATFPLAPEVLRGESPTPSSDVYALGMCLVFALTGRPPSRSEDGRLDIPLGAPRALVDVLRKMTDVDAEARPSALDASRALFEASALSNPPTGAVRVARTTDGAVALRDLEVLERAPDEFFDRIARIASSLVKAPIALLSLVSDRTVSYRGHAGIDLPPDVPVQGSLCAQTAEYATPWAMVDIWSDPRARHTTPVVGPDAATSFAAAPLLSHDGLSLGALSVYDPERREFTPQDLDDLARLARMAMRDLELSSTGRRSRDVTH